MSDNGNPKPDCFGTSADDFKGCGECDLARDCMDAWATGQRLASGGVVRPLTLQAKVEQEIPEPDPEALYFNRLIRAGVDPRDAAAEIDAGCLGENDWCSSYVVIR